MRFRSVIAGGKSDYYYPCLNEQLGNHGVFVNAKAKY
jgi:hypothetical protein